MSNFANIVDRCLAKLNSEIQRLNNENPVESYLYICPGCRELFNEDDFWNHELECEELAPALKSDPTDSRTIFERLLKKHSEHFDESGNFYA